MKLVGDTHGLSALKNIINSKNITGENIIHVGDFGLGFRDLISDMKSLIDLNDFLSCNGNKLYVIRGNHDNPIFWQPGRLKMPKLYSIDLVPDYGVRLIEDKIILFIGGAISIDRLARIGDYDWWPDEEFIYDEYILETAINKIKSLGKTLDIVVTHTAPDSCYPRGTNNQLVQNYINLEATHGFMGRNLEQELIEERLKLTTLKYDLIDAGLIPKQWFFGHFHSSKTETIDDIEFNLLNINEVKHIK